MTMITTSIMTEAELIAACLSNNRLAQKQLYEKYCNAMYTVAYRITNDFEAANDVLQEAFVKIFRALHKFEQRSTLGAWIKTIVVRTALSYIRKVKETEPIDYRAENISIHWGNNNLDIEYLEQAIQALPEGYRAVFVLIEIEGYAHKEVAEMLGVSIGTSKSQLFYAKKKLREILSPIIEN